MNLNKAFPRFLKKKIRDYKKLNVRKRNAKRFENTFKEFATFTMIPKEEYIRNLELAYNFANVLGSIVECGVWRGGMIAGMASIFSGNRKYYLFDSFEGLPPVKDIDGEDAAHWQNNTQGIDYFDNCSAEESFAIKAMKLTNVKSENIHIIKGWFNETLPINKMDTQIALLRLDGDWYDSTYTCLENLFPSVAVGGIIIIDDYYVWEGCTKAVHDYLSKEKRPENISQFNNRTAYIIKN